MNSGSSQQNWFHSPYFKTWIGGSAVAVIYMPLVTIFTRGDSLKVCIIPVQTRFGVLSRIAERGVHILGWQFGKPLFDLVVHTNSVLSHSPFFLTRYTELLVVQMDLPQFPEQPGKLTLFSRPQNPHLLCGWRGWKE